MFEESQEWLCAAGGLQAAVGAGWGVGGMEVGEAAGGRLPAGLPFPSGFCGVQDEGVAGSRAGGSASQHFPEWPGQVCLLPSRDPPHLAVSAGVISSRGRGLFCKGRAKETPALVIRRR